MLEEQKLNAQGKAKLEVYLTETEDKFNLVASKLLGENVVTKLVEENL